MTVVVFCICYWSQHESKHETLGSSVVKTQRKKKKKKKKKGNKKLKKSTKGRVVANLSKRINDSVISVSVSISVCLSVCLPVYLYVFLCLCLLESLPLFSVCLSLPIYNSLLWHTSNIQTTVCRFYQRTGFHHPQYFDFEVSFISQHSNNLLCPTVFPVPLSHYRGTLSFWWAVTPFIPITETTKQGKLSKE